MLRRLVLLLCTLCLPLSVAAQTSDAGFNEALSPSMAGGRQERCTARFAAIWPKPRKLMPAEDYAFKATPAGPQLRRADRPRRHRQLLLLLAGEG